MAINSMINELSLYVTDDDKGLSTIQMQILLSRHQKMTYRQILSQYNLSCMNVITTCLKRTSLGRRWVPGFVGGNDSYLGEIDQIKFIKKAEVEADSINCLPTCVAVAYAHLISQQRAKFARLLLIGIHSEQLAESIKDPEAPRESWLRGYCYGTDIRLARPQELELIRRTSCDVDAIFSFFENNFDVLDRDHHLIFNMDETMVSAKKKFKVLVKKGKIPLTTAPQVAPHITGCVTIGAAGVCFPPLFILKEKKTLKGLETFADSCYFCSSASGWMNRRVFIIWTLLFITQIGEYRSRLPPNLRDETILLITDGHGSRHCYLACFLLWIFNIDLLLLPGHTSHVMQPFDVGIASPLKTNYRRSMLDQSFDIEGNNIKSTIKSMRDLMITSFLDAISVSCTRTNVLKSFKCSGIFPIDPSIPLSSQFTMLNPNHKPPLSGAEIINDIDGLSKLFKNETGRDLTPNDLSLSLEKLDDIVNKLQDRQKDGLLLSDMPPCHLNLGNKWELHRF